MANPIQLSLLDNPDDPLGPGRGFFVPETEIVNLPPKPPTNAIKKRDKRRSWYVQTVCKKPKTDGQALA